MRILLKTSNSESHNKVNKNKLKRMKKMMMNLIR